MIAVRDTRGRLVRAQSAAAQRGLDAVLISPGSDLRWLTGHHPPPLERLTCLVVPSSGRASLVVPALEGPAAQACDAVREGGVHLATWRETDDPFQLVGALLEGALGRQPAQVAVSDRMWAAHIEGLRAALGGADWLTAGALLADLRVVKDAAEVQALREAAAAIDRVHAGMGEWLRPGRTEREVGADVGRAITDEGHERVNFVIVGSGPNGASPHASVTDRVLRPGDPVVVDIGGTMPSGYCSDCTRTYVVPAYADAPQQAEVDEAFCRMYEVLRRAQQAGLDAVRPGVRAESVDHAARSVIDAAGYGSYFIHRTGHGIGLDEHEEPWIVAGDETLLAPGMAFSVEPGIYLPGRFGARIEDIVVVTDSGVEVLDTADRSLLVP